MAELKQTLLKLQNAVMIEEIGNILSEGGELSPDAYLEITRIEREDKGASITETALLSAVWRIRELQKEIKRLKGDA